MNLLLKEQLFVDKISKVNTTTFKGKQLIENYASAIRQTGNPFISLYNFVDAGLTAKFDKGVYAAAKEIKDKIEANAPTLFRLGIILETLKDHQLTHKIFEDLQYLINYEESDLVKALKNNVLKNYTHNKLISSLHEQYGTDVVMKSKLVENLKVFTPISYYENKNGRAIFVIEKAILAFGKDRIVEGADVTDNFMNVNNSIDELEYDPDNGKFSADTCIGTIEIDETGDLSVNGDEKSVDEFKEQIEEFGVGKHPSIIAKDARVFDNLITVKENFNQICYIDFARTVKDVFNGNSMTVINHPKYTLVLENNTRSIRLHEFDSLSEAVSFVKTNMKVDMSEQFKSSLNKELKEQKVLKRILSTESSIIEELIKLRESVNDHLSLTDENTEAFENFSNIRNNIDSYVNSLKTA